MNRFVVSIVVVALAVGVLVAVAVKESSKSVVTVAELVSQGNAATHGAVRLGARVTGGEIHYETEPQYLLEFHVRDIQGTQEIPVAYHGVMPDTLKEGRDVIVEGTYDGKTFQAVSLLTQCPSKYKPPVPTGAS